MAPAIARRTQIDGNARNGRARREDSPETEMDGGGYALNDFDAVLLQIFITKRVIRLADAIAILTSLARVTGHHSSPEASFLMCVRRP